MLAIREASPLELAGWDGLVQRFDNHRIVHTRAWINWLEACGHGRPLYLILELDGQVVGCVPGLVVRLGFVRLFGSPIPGRQTPSMGPVFDRRRVTTQELATSLITFLERRHGVQHIELMGNDFEAEAMAALGFGGGQVPTFRARLFPNDGARVLKGFKESARRNVRRGEKLGLVVRFDDDERFVDEHYSQLREVFVRGGNTVPFGSDGCWNSSATCGPPTGSSPSRYGCRATAPASRAACSPSRRASYCSGRGRTAPGTAGTGPPNC